MQHGLLRQSGTRTRRIYEEKRGFVPNRQSAFALFAGQAEKLQASVKTGVAWCRRGLGAYASVDHLHRSERSKMLQNNLRVSQTERAIGFNTCVSRCRSLKLSWKRPPFFGARRGATSIQSRIKTIFGKRRKNTFTLKQNNPRNN